MRLILLRHAKSEKAEPGMRDHARGLTERGRADAQAIGGYLAHHALIPDLVLVSDAQRTRETWEHVASALAAPPEGPARQSKTTAPPEGPARQSKTTTLPPVTFEPRLYDAGKDAIVAVIRESKVRALMVIGHNPGLHETARLLIASGDVEARERLNEGLPTSGLAVIDFAGDDWRKLHAHGGRLERFVTPRSLAAADRV
jgi:phosphohistidine phosphatase